MRDGRPHDECSDIQPKRVDETDVSKESFRLSVEYSHAFTIDSIRRAVAAVLSEELEPCWPKEVSFAYMNDLLTRPMSEHTSGHWLMILAYRKSDSWMGEAFCGIPDHAWFILDLWKEQAVFHWWTQGKSERLFTKTNDLLRDSSSSKRKPLCFYFFATKTRLPLQQYQRERNAFYIDTQEHSHSHTQHFGKRRKEGGNNKPISGMSVANMKSRPHRF